MHPLPAGPAYPIGFAHRGARAERRDNTLGSFARALELGATGLESDAWLAADGQVVLDHDGVTGRLGRRRAISSQARADLPRHIPSLGDLYATCGTGFELSLDVKDPAAIHSILDSAGAVGAVERLWLCHHDLGLLSQWRAPAGEARLVQSTRLERLPDGIETRSRTLREAGIDALNLHRCDWTAQRVATVHSSGLGAFGWDAQTSAEIGRLLAWGVDGLYSDHVERLMSAIARLPR